MACTVNDSCKSKLDKLWCVIFFVLLNLLGSTTQKEENKLSAQNYVTKKKQQWIKLKLATQWGQVKFTLSEFYAASEKKIMKRCLVFHLWGGKKTT